MRLRNFYIASYFFGLMTLSYFLLMSRKLHYFRKSACLDFLYNFSSSFLLFNPREIM